MATTAFQSLPSPSADIAQSYVQGLIAQAGQGGEVKITSMNVIEIDGMWIASASVEITPPEEDVEEEEQKISVQYRPEAEPDHDQSYGIYYLQTRPLSVAQEAIPDYSEELIEFKPSENPANLEPPADDYVQDSKDRDEDSVLIDVPVSESADLLADQLIQDYNEEAAPVSPIITAELLEQERRERELAGLPPVVIVPEEGLEPAR